MPTIELTAEPSTIPAGGDFVLRWDSTGADSVLIDNDIGTLAAAGSMPLSTQESRTYTATATNSAGSASASTRVTVTEAEPVRPTPVADSGLTIDDIVRQGLIRDLFFDLDQHSLKPESTQILQQNAVYIRQYPGASFILEGHCDERGSAEYNLALGDRRAQAVKQYLESLGIPPSRLETVSYGEERPFAQGHDESAWSQNRRVHFTLRR